MLKYMFWLYCASVVWKAEDYAPNNQVKIVKHTCAKRKSPSRFSNLNRVFLLHSAGQTLPQTNNASEDSRGTQSATHWWLHERPFRAPVSKMQPCRDKAHFSNVCLLNTKPVFMQTYKKSSTAPLNDGTWRENTKKVCILTQICLCVN